MKFFTFALFVSLAILNQSWSVSARSPTRVSKIGEIWAIKSRLGSIYNQDSVDRMIQVHGITNARVKGIFEVGSVLYEELGKQQKVGISADSDTVSRLGAVQAEMVARHHLATEIRFVKGRMTVQDFVQEFEMLLTTNKDLFDLFSADRIALMNDYLHNGIAPIGPPPHHGMEMEWRELQFGWPPDLKGITFIEDYRN